MSHGHAHTSGSQIMLEEFGKFPANRDQFFGAIYDAVLTSASTGGPLKGVAFWQWYDDGQARMHARCSYTLMAAFIPASSSVPSNCLSPGKSRP